MTNPYFNPSGNPATGSEGLSALMRGEFIAIGLAFDLMPRFSSTGLFDTVFTQQGNFTFILPAAPGTLATAANVATETARALAAEAAETTARIASVNAEVARATTAEGLLAPKLNPTITGLHETSIALAALNIDCNAATIFTKTIVAISTLTVSNVPASGTSASFILELTNGGAFAITWWPGVKWSDGVAPTLTASGVDALGFYTVNGGATWRGLLLAANLL